MRHGHAQRGRVSRTYRIWTSMLNRCRNPKNIGWARYGGRGIRVCDRWKDFALFLADMGEAPEGMSIEREDTDGPYDPDNCRWATKGEQDNNRSSNIIVGYQGVYRTVAQWSEATGIPYPTLYRRLVVSRWPTAWALNTPVRRSK